jgi:hypothetical protein
MAKVGTQSVTNSIRKTYKGTREPHLVHSMDIETFPFVVSNPGVDRNWGRLCKGRRLIKHARRAKVITVVRDPVARNISLLFHFIEYYTGCTLPELSEMSIEELMHAFLKKVHHGVPLLWFDVELKQVLGIDVYDYPFPHQQGYLTLRRGKIDLLILKLETDDRIKEQAIAEFLNKKDFKLVRANVTASKATGQLYQDFLQQAQLPSWYVEALYRSKYMRHFYTKQEIDNFRARWLHSTQVLAGVQESKVIDS